MPPSISRAARRIITFVAAALSASATPLVSSAQFINPFGNGVLPTIKAEDQNGISGIADNRGTGGIFPNDQIDIDGEFGLLVGLADLLGRVRGLPPTTDPGEIQEREQIVDGLLDIAGLLTTKLDSGGPPATSLGSVFGVNPSATVAGINDTARAIASLTERNVLTSDAVSLSVAVVANADPFFVMTGSITNASAAQPLNLFLPFEEAFLDPIPLDAPLLRELFISTELRDTDGDGAASLQSAELSFQVQATTDTDNPSLGNTDPIGVSESLGLPRLRNPGVEFFRFADAAEVDNSLFVSQRAEISHATGQLVLRNLSPGDTVDFTAILSLGIEGDPLTPLIPAASLRSLLLGAELVAQNAVPEPSAALLAICGIAATAARRRR
ncbi:MAG: hypothetical protein AAF596_05500, partial [Planctomycetota bacterium]